MLQTEQSEICRLDFLSVYYSNLRYAFPLNSHGTCAYTSLAMLLSYFDTFWDDRYVEEGHDFRSYFYVDECLDQRTIPNFKTDSPGVRTEWDQDVRSLSNEHYMGYCECEAHNNLQSYLILLARDYFKWPMSGSLSNPYALTVTQELILLNLYARYKRTPINGWFTVNVLQSGSSDSKKRDFIMDNISSGLPVLLNLRVHPGKSSEYHHTVVAYDYSSPDGSLENVYVHPGWQALGGENPLTHVSLRQLSGVDHGASGYYERNDYCGDSEIESAISLTPLASSSFSDNYSSWDEIIVDTQDLMLPHNIRNVAPEARDCAPIFEWDYLPIDRWNGGESSTFKLEILNSLFAPIFTFVFPLGNFGRFAVPADVWRMILEDSADWYFVKVGFSDRDSSLDDKYTLTCRVFKPNAFNGAVSFSPFDLFETQSVLPSGIGCHRTINGIGVYVSTFGCAYNHSGPLILGPDAPNGEASLELCFDVPILRIDIFALTENINLGGTFQVLVAVDDSSTYMQLQSDSSLPCSGRPEWVPFISYRAIRRVKFSFSANAIPAEACCLPKMFVERFAVWNHLPTNGDEVPYEPERWNSSDRVERHNCYSYALNCQVDDDGNVFDGMLGWATRTTPGINEWQILPTFLSDYQRYFRIKSVEDPDLSFYVKVVDRFEVCPRGMYKIASAFSESDGYHWYRQNPDGTWSQKDGHNPVTNCDCSGEVIVDPLIADRGIYDRFFCYFAVRPMGRMADEI